MEAMLFLLPIALLLGGGALAAFLWALRSGQFDDPDGDAVRILFEGTGPARDGVDEKEGVR